MHVLQYIAVQADNEDLAMRTVEDTLNSELGSDEYMSSAWFDWFVIGGGRFVDGDPYKSSPNYIISYDKDPQGYRDMIDRMMSNRKVEFSGYRKDVDLDKLTYTLDNYDPSNHDMFALSNVYAVKKCMDMLMGTWDFNSYFYDMHTASTNTKWMYEGIDKGNKNWYIVPVDFHF